MESRTFVHCGGVVESGSHCLVFQGEVLRMPIGYRPRKRDDLSLFSRPHTKCVALSCLARRLANAFLNLPRAYIIS